MASLECEKCKTDINSYRERVQVLDPVGFTHTFCKSCGDDYQRRIEASNASIAETGKLGHLKDAPRGSGVTF